MTANHSYCPCANTTACWEIQGVFTIIFHPSVSLHRFRGHAGVFVHDASVTVLHARIKQAYRGDSLLVFVGANEAPISVPYDVVVEITDEEGVVWR